MMKKPSDCSPEVQGEIIRLMKERGLTATHRILKDEWPIRRSPRVIPNALEFTIKQLRYFAQQQGLESVKGRKKKLRVAIHYVGDTDETDCATDLPTVFQHEEIT